MREALNNPLWVFAISAVVAIVCLAVSFVVFETSVGLFTTFLITMAMTPFMLNLVRYEEEKEEEFISQMEQENFLKRHGDFLKIYAAFFVGVLVSLSIVYILVPEKTAEKIFENQITEINKIRGNVAFADTLLGIVSNNVGVLFLAFLFSFLLGVGAVLILTWNASVLAVAIGSIAKSIGGVKAIPVAALPFLPHGTLEILAYFIGGLAGGLVSVAIMRKKSGKFWLIVKDSLNLMVVSIVILVIAGIVEAVALGL